MSVQSEFYRITAKLRHIHRSSLRLVGETYLESGAYTPVPSDDPASLKEQQVLGVSAQTSDHRIITKIGLISLYTIVASLCLWASIDLTSRARQAFVPNTEPSCYCGETLAQAQSLGCSYVAMASAWLPMHCRDTALEEDFDSLGPGDGGRWQYYKDHNTTSTFEPQEIADFAGTTQKYYNTWEWHVLHCLFYWRKTHRSHFTKVTVEPRFNTDAHIHHCTKLILSQQRTAVTTSGIDTGDTLLSLEQQREMVDWKDIRDGLV